MGLVTALAVHAGWLYGGTLIAGLIASVRKVRLMRARRQYVLAQERNPATREQRGAGGPGRSPRAAAAGRPAGSAPQSPAASPASAAAAAAAAKAVRAGAGAAAARRTQRP